MKTSVWIEGRGASRSDDQRQQGRPALARLLGELADELMAIKSSKRFAMLPDEDFAALQPLLESLLDTVKDSRHSRLIFRAETLSSVIDDMLAQPRGPQVRFFLKRSFDDFLVELQRALSMETERHVVDGGATDRPVILVVDDNRHDCIFAQRALGKSCDVICVSSVKDALKELHTTRADIILLDIHMPGMPGTGLLNFLKDVPQLASIPVLMRSGDSCEEAVVSSMVGGAIDYLSKDFEPEEMAARVHMTLASGRMRLNSQPGR